MSRPSPPPRRRNDHRDRHGRGLRRALAPPEVPLSRSRSEQFDELVLDAVEAAEQAVRQDRPLAERLTLVEIGVEDLPPEEVLAAAEAVGEPVPLGRAEPGRKDAGGNEVPARLVVYRRPVELRGKSIRGRAAIIQSVVVERMAELLGVPPERFEEDGPPA